MAQKPDKEAIYDNLVLELRRGVLVLAVLSQLRKEEYGYSLKSGLANQGLDVNEGTLYPLLRRLEKHGLLASDWRVIDGKRPRRYYRLSSVGEALLGNLTAEWYGLVESMHELLSVRKGET